MIGFPLIQPELRVPTVDHAVQISYPALSQIEVQRVGFPLGQFVDMPGLQQVLLGVWPEAEIKQLVMKMLDNDPFSGIIQESHPADVRSITILLGMDIGETDLVPIPMMDANYSALFSVRHGFMGSSSKPFHFSQWTCQGCL